jgi:hypothetical protein
MLPIITLTGVEAGMKPRLLEAMRSLGLFEGNIGNLKTDTTHLVAADPYANYEKYEKATQLAAHGHLCIVRPEWLLESASCGVIMPESNYPAPCFFGLRVSFTGFSEGIYSCISTFDKMIISPPYISI